MIRKFLLGYDLRLKQAAYISAVWPKDKRQRFLIRPEIEWPLSVDKHVWPSIFKYIGFSGTYTFVDFGTEEQSDQIEVEASGVQQYRLELWPNSSKMIRLARTHHLLNNTVPIAVSLVADENEIRKDPFWSEVLERKLTRKSLPGDYRFLGYDIADREFISALSNCGYENNEKVVLRRSWKARLNEFGLLLELEDADRFAIFSDQRVPEHAPFFVYALLGKGL